MIIPKLAKFVELYNGPKICAVFAGGGASFGNITTIPGSSKVLHSTMNVYSNESLLTFLKAAGMKQNPDNSIVSSLTAMDLLEASVKNFPHYNDIVYIATTSAMTSNRYRRGANHAYIAYRWYVNENDVRQFGLIHHEFSKYTEKEHESLTLNELSNKRLQEDIELTQRIIKVLTNLNTGYI